MSPTRILGEQAFGIAQPALPALGLLLALASLIGAGRQEWLRGYRRTIAGEKISYHSPYPESKAGFGAPVPGAGLRFPAGTLVRRIPRRGLI
jgi:hypothetical protein